MKQFFNTMFACVLGVMIAGIIGFFIFFFSVISITLFNSQTYDIKDNTVFKLSLNAPVIEVKSGNDFTEFMSVLEDAPQPILLTDILKSIQIAASDSRIKGIYLNTDNYNGSYATSSQIRTELEKFKKSGKFIIAYNNYFSQGQYFLSSVADSLFVNPMGGVEIAGLSSKQIFLKNTLEKFGIEPEVFRVGTFKAAVEPYILDKMSDANREQTQTYMNSIWGYISSQISESRQLSIEEVNKLADDGVSFVMAKNLKNSGLFTAVKYESDVKTIIERFCDNKEPKFATTADLSASFNDAISGNEVAILCAEGEIIDNKGEGIYAPRLIKEINKLKEDNNVKAVIFRVNSPGGSAFASEQIWKAIAELKEKKPVVVSMGTYAASGGYYISCNADYIIAEPTTLTGSIGVFGLMFNANKLFTKDLGLNFDEVKTNKFGQITIFEPIKPEEKALIQNNVEEVYDIFINRCADGRDMSVENIKKIAEGRVWSGVDALKIGLVDQLGGLDEAAAKAFELADIQDASIKVYPKPKTIFENILENLNSDLTVNIKRAVLGNEYNKYIFFNNLKNKTGIQARMPEITIQ